MTGKMSRRILTVIPSSPQAREVDIRCRAWESSGSVTGPRRKAPLTTRGGRGEGSSDSADAAAISVVVVAESLRYHIGSN